MGILEIFSPSDPELVKKTLARIDEQDKWNDVFSTKLIELLDNIDGLKKDIRERMRRIEAVKLAESMLLDEAAKTETLNAKLAETKRVLDLGTQEFKAAKSQYTGAEELREKAEGILAEAESRFKEARGLLESAAVTYRRAAETGDSSANAYIESERQLILSVQKLTEAGKIADRMALEAAANTASLDEKLIKIESAVDAARQEFQAAKVQYKIAEELCNETRGIFRDAGFRYSEAKGLAESAEIQYRKAEAAETSSAHAYDESKRQVVLSSQKLLEADNSTREARNLLDRSTSELKSVRIVEEKATADLRAAEQALEASKGRLIAATDVFKKATRWVVLGAVVSWSAVAWMAWSTFRPVLPLWGPCVATAIFLLGGGLVLKAVKHEA